MATLMQLHAQWENKRLLYWALMSGAPEYRVRQLMDRIPYDTKE